MRGILCQARGSAANSAVCYVLGVTEVDPARMDLLLERFISKERCFALLQRSGMFKRVIAIAKYTTIRNAASTPFHTCDCHIRNHSPPIAMKPTNHNASPRARA